MLKFVDGLADKPIQIDGKDRPMARKARKNRKTKPVVRRNKSVTDAWLRSGAGAMKDRRQPRGGTKSWRDHLEDGS